LSQSPGDKEEEEGEDFMLRSALLEGEDCMLRSALLEEGQDCMLRSALQAKWHKKSTTPVLGNSCSHEEPPVQVLNKR